MTDSGPHSPVHSPLSWGKDTLDTGFTPEDGSDVLSPDDEPGSRSPISQQKASPESGVTPEDVSGSSPLEDDLMQDPLSPSRRSRQRVEPCLRMPSLRKTLCLFPEDTTRDHDRSHAPVSLLRRRKLEPCLRLAWAYSPRTMNRDHAHLSLSRRRYRKHGR